MRFTHIVCAARVCLCARVRYLTLWAAAATHPTIRPHTRAHLQVLSMLYAADSGNDRVCGYALAPIGIGTPGVRVPSAGSAAEIDRAILHPMLCFGGPGGSHVPAAMHRPSAVAVADLIDEGDGRMRPQIFVADVGAAPRPRALHRYCTDAPRVRVPLSLRTYCARSQSEREAPRDAPRCSRADESAKALSRACCATNTCCTKLHTRVRATTTVCGYTHAPAPPH